MTDKLLPETNDSADVPILTLRDVVVFPHMVIPLFVGREKSINALNQAMSGNKKILLVAQKEALADEPERADIYDVGTAATILQLLKLPDGTVKVLVEGAHRERILNVTDDHGYFAAQTTPLETVFLDARENEVLTRSLLNQFEQYAKLNKKIQAEVLPALASIEDPERLVDTIAAHMTIKVPEKQGVLEEADLRKRLELVMELIEIEIDLLEVEKRVRGRVKKQMEKSQREYYLNEQIKSIQKELGEMDEAHNELEEFTNRIEKAGLPKEAEKKAKAELSKLKLMSPMSAEATVSRSYLDWILNVPWKKHSKISHDLQKAEKVLDKEHYGLEKVKERILEYLAVQQRVRKLKGPILCLVGPPGVGKTSLGESIAHATNRKFVRMALGGVRDEAEIRGHRRTYIGSMPGKIIQKLSKVGVRNPLFLLDEIDKMAMDFRGDPASALLEVLDPEQNNAFNDHYLEVDYDLSEIMFVTTSNSMNIPAPLLDRMEVIRLAGYTEDEKVNIALQHLLPKQFKVHGIKENELAFSEETMREIIRYYTREAGVRNLEREIAKVCRKVVKELLEAKGKTPKIILDKESLEKYLGVHRFRYGLAEEYDQIGQINGLAWTEFGGELLTIEAAVVPGTGKTMQTGQLGDVMKESIQAAMTVVRTRAESLGLHKDFYEKIDVHIHVPEGATPKDGPSAGIGMCTALVSVLTNIPVRADVAMTGEITLRGEILPIGGLKEKLLAARRGGIKTVILPEENMRDIKEIPDNIKENLDIRPVKWIDEALEIALSGQPAPKVTQNEEDIPSVLKKHNKGEGKPPSIRPH